MKLEQKIAVKRSFDALGVLVEPGHLMTVDTDRLSGKEKNFVDAGDFQPSIVTVSPLGPAGPNPKMPQQIPPDAIQNINGYAQPGAVLVGDVTAPAEVRFEADGISPPGEEDKQTGQSDLAELMAEAPGGSGQNSDDALVAGTVKDVTADLGAKTDGELEQLRAAEIDREKPRSGVLNAIKAEQEARAANA